MPDTALGLLIGLGIDASDAKQALGEFEKLTGDSFQKASRAPRQLDDALLNTHQSMHLLLEEMGIHLPRAVVGAMSEMVPQIASFGGILLGAFAIEEIPKLVGGIKETIDAWEGFGEAERRAMKKAIDDTETLHTRVVDISQELALFGKNEAEQAAMRAGWAQDDSDRALKRLDDAQKNLETLNAKIEDAGKHGIEAVDSAGTAYAGVVKAATLEVNKAREAWDLANEQAVLAHKRAAQAAAEQEKQIADKSAAEEEKAANKSIALGEKVQALRNRLDMQRIHNLQGIGREVRQQEEDQEKENKAIWQYNQFIEKMVRDDQAWLPLQQRTVDLARQEVQVFTADTTAVKHLSAAYSEYLLIKQDAANVSRSFMAAIKDEVQGVNDDMLGGMKNLAEGAVALTGSQKAAAAFKVGYEIAEGLACLASGTWPPNPAAIVAAGIHFEAATQYAIASGRSGAHGHSSGGGSYRGGGSERFGDGGGSNYGGPPQTLAPGAAGGGSRFGGTLHVMVVGESQAGEWLAGTLNKAVNRGVTLIATSSQRGSPVGH
jgi:hypothetical protein